MKFWNIYFCSFGCQQGAFQVVYGPKKRVVSFLFFFLKYPRRKRNQNPKFDILFVNFYTLH